MNTGNLNMGSLKHANGLANSNTNAVGSCTRPDASVDKFRTTNTTLKLSNVTNVNANETLHSESGFTIGFDSYGVNQRDESSDKPIAASTNSGFFWRISAPPGGVIDGDEEMQKLEQTMLQMLNSPDKD